MFLLSILNQKLTERIIHRLYTASENGNLICIFIITVLKYYLGVKRTIILLNWLDKPNSPLTVLYFFFSGIPLDHSLFFVFLLDWNWTKILSLDIESNSRTFSLWLWILILNFEIYSWILYTDFEILIPKLNWSVDSEFNYCYFICQKIKFT